MKIRKQKRSNFAGSAFPIGSCVLTPTDMFYMQGGSRLRIPSKNVYESWNFPHTLLADSHALVKYPVLGKLGFRPGTVIYSLEDGLYYLIEKNTKRQITDSRWFEWLNIDRLDVMVASAEDAKLHKTGKVLSN